MSKNRRLSMVAKTYINRETKKVFSMTEIGFSSLPVQIKRVCDEYTKRTPKKPNVLKDED